jgi:hypothetical protein
MGIYADAKEVMSSVVSGAEVGTMTFCWRHADELCRGCFLEDFNLVLSEGCVGVVDDDVIAARALWSMLGFSGWLLKRSSCVLELFQQAAESAAYMGAQQAAK